MVRIIFPTVSHKNEKRQAEWMSENTEEYGYVSTYYI